MKITRTQINDLPESFVELSELELRVVRGGLNSLVGCYSLAAGVTQRHTGNDWDTDSDPLPPHIAL